MSDSPRTGIEPIFPAVSGVMALLLVMGALFALPAEFALLLTGILFFSLGILFSRGEPRFSWGAAAGILAPFLFTSAFLVTAFGLRYLVFPVLAAGGVTSGVAVRRRSRPVAGAFMLGALWLGVVFIVACFVLPHVFGGVSSTGLVPKF